jgi:hypothetical protein
MKRSSARRARRWVVQELARSLDQLSDIAVNVASSADVNSSPGGEQSSLSEI